ncbi:MAG: PAS domain S-box [Parcubacteria group bacterium GW2011_GWA2_47_7]|nr:MAG: PAS domain S-box [Parcubacteria group bacterium GW2011_GWA2_47_7]
MTTKDLMEHCDNIDYREMGNLLPVMIFIYCRNKIAYVNERCALTTGYSTEELTSPDFQFRRLMSEEHLSKTLKNFEYVVEGKQVEDFEFSITTKSGDSRNAIMSVKAVGCGNDVKAAFCVVRDVTERRRIERDMANTEIKYRDIIDRMSEGLVIQDNNRIITYVNPRAGEILGYFPTELIGKHGSIMFDEENMKIVEREYQKHIHGIATSYEAGWRRKNGKNVDTLISARPIMDVNNEFNGSVVVFTDITELKKKTALLLESEEKFRLLMDEVPQIIFLYSEKEGRLVYTNPHMHVALGYTAEEMTSSDFDVNTVILQKSQSPYDPNGRLREQGGESFAREILVSTKWGETLTLSLFPWVLCIHRYK